MELFDQKIDISIFLNFNAIANEDNLLFFR